MSLAFCAQFCVGFKYFGVQHAAEVRTMRRIAYAAFVFMNPPATARFDFRGSEYLKPSGQFTKSNTPVHFFRHSEHLLFSETALGSIMYHFLARCYTLFLTFNAFSRECELFCPYGFTSKWAENSLEKSRVMRRVVLLGLEIEARGGHRKRSPAVRGTIVGVILSWPTHRLIDACIFAQFWVLIASSSRSFDFEIRSIALHNKQVDVYFLLKVDEQVFCLFDVM